MSSITDDYMREVIKTRKTYTLVVFRSGPKADAPSADKMVWEHGRRNLKLRKDGIVDLIIGVRDEWEIEGLDVFNTSVNETRRIMEEDPAVKAGVLTYEIHPAVSFPGDALSGKSKTELQNPPV
jgi:hypothetical protein